MRYPEAVSEDEGEDWHNETIKKEVGKETYGDSREDEEGIGTPFETHGLFGVIGRGVCHCGVLWRKRGKHKGDRSAYIYSGLYYTRYIAQP